MDISIIIPVHNLENFIVKTLDSIAMQDYNTDRFELVIVFDSCTDRSKEVVAEWASRHPALKISTFDSACKNPGGTRNVGLDNATGEFIFFMDGDDWFIPKTALSEMVGGIGNHTALRVGTFETKNTNSLGIDTLWRYLFRRDFIGGSRMQDITLGEDVQFVDLLMQKEGWSLVQIEGPLYFYNSPRVGSITTVTFGSKAAVRSAVLERELLRMRNRLQAENTEVGVIREMILICPHCGKRHDSNAEEEAAYGETYKSV